MALQLLETRKAHNHAFLKIKAIRNQPECFKVNPISISIYENKSERFSKKHTQDFTTKSFYDPNYSQNSLERNTLMTSIAETLIGKKIEVTTPYHKRNPITLEHTKGLRISRTIESQIFCSSKNAITKY